eukprot:3523450-Pyramimonas_sp.AAC.1
MPGAVHVDALAAPVPFASAGLVNAGTGSSRLAAPPREGSRSSWSSSPASGAREAPTATLPAMWDTSVL